MRIAGKQGDRNKLNRTTFKTSRLLDFCSEKELTTQTGHEKHDWPLVVVKELLDNALDACEEADTPPEVAVTVDADGITVADNGPGIPHETIEGVLNYSVRVSNREAYVSPTRGAQGNALKCIVAMPFVVDANRGRVDITAHGERHEITFKVDHIRQEPAISREVYPAKDVKTGTIIKVSWPDLACSILRDAEDDFLQLADDFTFLNPHLTMSVVWFGCKTRTEATDLGWEKWVPSRPTSAHWYGLDDFERLISAYVTHDQNRGVDRSVREFVREFNGLTGSAKQKAVLEATGLSRTNLSALADSDGLQHDLTEKLLIAMQANSKPVKPAALGVIGKDHIEKRFADLGCRMQSFQYKKIRDFDNDGLPIVVETAFGWRGRKCEEGRRLIVGVNWSPGIVDPFRSLGSSYGDSLSALLENRYAGEDAPIALLLHCACPRVQYTDRGKSALVMK